MKKSIKTVLGIVGILAVLLVVAVLTLPMTIGPIVKTAASVGGPKALGVAMSVGDVKFSPLAGNLVISQVKVGNPEGYSDKDAFVVEKIEVGLNLRSLLTDTVVIKNIQIDAPVIVFEHKNGKSNFDTMMANAKKAADEEKAKTGKEKSGKKVVIETFRLNDAEVSYASSLTLGKALGFKLPPLELHDIGKTSGGITAADAATQVLAGIANGLAKSVTNLGGSAVKASSDAAKSLIDTLKTPKK